MKLKAYQLVDLNNPISVEYSTHSINSFEPVSDILDIEPIQCVVPSTLPTDRFYGDSPVRSVYEQSCFASHYMLVKRLAEGEKFIIMEHDAYLWPERVNIFRELIQEKVLTRFDAFYLGIANEFYTLKRTVASAYMSLFNENLRGGPLFHAGASYELVRATGKPNMRIMFPVDGQTNKICSSVDIKVAASGRGRIFDAPVTQHFKLSSGSTILERRNNWVTTRENSPNMFFTD